ncbi:Holliday junction resolvase RuvX [Candidatus Babeliales bacterium]|nr:Holliday junction resolvase RuvX [Candidatus Babeliales bacterium]
MKILGLDLGDRWVGSALADPLGISCRPYETVELENLETFLRRAIPDQDISVIVVGYPKTMGAGTESDQTRKTVKLKEELEQKFTNVDWVLWDERLSSKRADQLKGTGKTPEEKRRQHSVAASFILQSYLDYKAFSSSQEDE